MMSIKIKSRHIVKPAEQTWSGTLPLSELDHLSYITHSSAIYFYNKPTKEEWLNNHSTNKIIDTLKDSLSQVLVPFYPLAGRLSWVEGARFKLECNAMGAELIEVESTMKVSDFGDFYPHSETTFGNLLPQIDYYGKPIEDLPVLTVQVTRFSCGGLSVGISMSHVVADGKSALHFYQEWGRLARGEPLQTAPFLDRRILQGVYDADGLVIDLNHNFGKLRLNEMKNWGKPATPTFIVFTKERVELLKEIANNNCKEIVTSKYKPYSSFTVLAALVWRSITIARELDGQEMTAITVVVDTRGRVKPPLPSSYFGNATIEVEAHSLASNLISRPLSYACSKVREACAKVTTEYVSSRIDFYKKQQNLSKYQVIEDRGRLDGPSTVTKNTVSVISWLNMGWINMDFGWGNEIHFGTPNVYSFDGETLISPYNDDGSVLITACVHDKEKFQSLMNSYNVQV